MIGSGETLRAHSVCAAIDSMPGLVGYVERRERKIYLNRAFNDWLGAAARDFDGQPFDEVAESVGLSNARAFIESALQGVGSQHGRVGCSRCAPGEILEMRCEPNRGGEGEVVGALLLVRVLRLGPVPRASGQCQRQLLQLARELMTVNEDLQRKLDAQDRSNRLAVAESQALERICRGEALADTLSSLCAVVEAFSFGGRCSILVFDEAGKVIATHAARQPAAGLPRPCPVTLPSAPAMPSHAECARAVLARRDVDATERQPAWAAPIVSTSGKRDGVLVVSYEKSTPPTADQRLAERAAHVAAVAMERHSCDGRLESVPSQDALTQLPNRRSFELALSGAVSRALRSGSMFALLFVDVDRFNDSPGHDRGDELLRQASQRLVGCLRPEDTVCRFGGDEFTVLLEGLDDPTSASRVAAMITSALAKGLEMDGKAQHLSCSVGVAVYPMDALDAQGLLRNADLAMHEAKRGRRNGYRSSDGTKDRGRGSWSALPDSTAQHASCNPTSRAA